MDVNELLETTISRGASDLHLASEQVPRIRLDGELQTLSENIVSVAEIEKILSVIMSAEQLETFKQEWELDFYYVLDNGSGFRVNAYYDSNGPAIAFRPIPQAIPSFSDIMLPDVFKDLCELPNGIVLVTGATGSGKSTTLASMIDYINVSYNKHILTVEDPIEFYHKSKNCLINQREVGTQTKTFNSALRAALREDPDIILVGELRDIETVRLALTAAETGHLVFATLHTSSAAKTINRIIDVFPAGDKPMVRSMLAESLRAVISQSLIKKASGSGRVAAREVLVCTPAVRNMIRQDLIPQIETAMQTGRNYGMLTMEQALQNLIQEGVIAKENAVLTW